MPTTRKKVIKTVYKNDAESEQDEQDFSYSSSDAVITDNCSSDEEAQISSSDDDFKTSKTTKRPSAKKNIKKTNFKKSFMSKLDKQTDIEDKNDIVPAFFSVKNLTAADKLLPSILNLSESDSSDDESRTKITKKNIPPSSSSINIDDADSENKTTPEYKDVWSKNIKDQSEEIAKEAFLKLQLHKSKIEETKISVQNYAITTNTNTECDVKDLLALGEEEILQPSTSNKTKKGKKKEVKVDSESEMEDWEEVKEAKTIPQQGLQVIVDIPHVSKKSKKVDVEMMMKRKINRVKKQHQVYLHKVHVLCWIGHGNYVSRILNDQTIMTSSLTLLPSKECYPGERVDMKYVEQITSWFKDKVTLKQDKHENKFRPKAPPLNVTLQEQIKKKTFSTKKYIVFVFVSMLRSLGLQCRVMFNFITLPIKPPSSELCSLSTKEKDVKRDNKKENKSEKGKTLKAKASKENIPQLDGNYDMSYSSDSDIMQLDGNDDILENKSKKQVNRIKNSKKDVGNESKLNDDVSPPKRARRNCTKKSEQNCTKTKIDDQLKYENLSENTKISGITQDSEVSRRSLSLKRIQTTNDKTTKKQDPKDINDSGNSTEKVINLRKTRNTKQTNSPKCDIPLTNAKQSKAMSTKTSLMVPEIVVKCKNDDVSSKYFENTKFSSKNSVSKSRKRPKTSEPIVTQAMNNTKTDIKDRKKRTQSTESKYFTGCTEENAEKKSKINKAQTDDPSDRSKRVNHRDLQKRKNVKVDVKKDLIHIIKGRVKEAKEDAIKLIVKEKIKIDSDEDSDYLPVQSLKRRTSQSDEDFKPHKISPKPLPKNKKIDRRIISTDDELLNIMNKIDVWCEIFVEELEEWISVDVITGRVHCASEIYGRASHPVTYVVGWDNNNYLKDLTRKYVPHWNTVTRKQRVETQWWSDATKLWLGPNTARDKEENERLDRMQLEAPLPKTIGEYKNHPLYALKRHLLKFEAIYPPDAATLGFIRSEPVYARDCVYVCRSRDTWLKEAKVVKLGEQPYKVVKARPKWDKLSNKVITDKPLEVFGPWQVQDYEPPVAENGIVPRNAYGNVELFKDCMLPKGTVHIKLSGLNRVAKKLNIDCAPAMTGFEFNGGWSHPVYDGFVVCQEYEEIIRDAWIKDQEEQERKEQEKIKARVSKNWWRLARGLLIKERLKAKYGFEEPSTSQEKKKKGPHLVVKKK